MGLAAGRTEGQGVVSPLREFEQRTEIIRSKSGQPGPRRFTRVPTHAVGVLHERRSNPRALLALPLRLKRIAGVAEPLSITLVTRNISSSGIYFLAPREMALGAAIELEVALVERPLGFGTVEMCTAAHIIRTDECSTPGWQGYAASFDDFALKRDDVIPMRVRSH